MNFERSGHAAAPKHKSCSGLLGSHQTQVEPGAFSLIFERPRIGRRDETSQSAHRRNPGTFFFFGGGAARVDEVVLYCAGAVAPPLSDL